MAVRFVQLDAGLAGGQGEVAAGGDSQVALFGGDVGRTGVEVAPGGEGEVALGLDAGANVDRAGGCRIIAMHVIQRSGKLNSKWTGHALIIAEEGAAMHDARPDPLLFLCCSLLLFPCLTVAYDAIKTLLSNSQQRSQLISNQ